MPVTYPKELASILSYPRLTKYREEAEKFSHKSDNEKVEIALRFYTWNTALSGAFYGPLQALEIALRNAINEQLANTYGKTWYGNKKFVKLDKGNVAKLKGAKKGAKTESEKKGKPYTANDIIANLSLKFWIDLLKHEILWHKEIHRAFSCENLTRKDSEKRRNDLYECLEDLRLFRNRIAHHEPIFHQNLKKNMANILDMLGWICPDERKRVERYIRLSEVIKMRPPNDTNLRF